MLTRRSFLAKAAAGTGLLATPAVLRAQDSSVYRLGALNPITGAGSPYGSGMQRMVLAAARIVNEAGGAGGRRIEIFAEDSQTNPQSGVLAARKLIDVNEVQGILGTWSSSVSLAVAPITNAADIFLMHTSGAPDLSVPPANEKGLLYRFQATNSRWGRAYARVLEREGFSRPATMAFNNAAGRSMIDSFSETWTAAGGTVTSAVVYEPNQPSYRSELQQILSSEPDVIVMGSYLSDLTMIMREWYQTGQPVAWVAPSFAANAELVRALGPDVVEGLLSADSVSNEQAPSFAAYDAAYQAEMGTSGLANNSAAMCWDMVIVLALAIEAAGTTDTDAVNAMVREIASPEGEKVYSFEEGKAILADGGMINYEGASSILDFDDYGDVEPNFGVFQFEGGTAVRKYVLEV